MDLLSPLEAVIRTELLPSLTGRDAPNDLERDFLGLPARLGGLGIVNPTTLTNEYAVSQKISTPLLALIVQQEQKLIARPPFRRS